MISRNAGQTMLEYLVVVSALVSTMFWGANATCPNPNSDLQYSNCIQNLLTTMHNKYEGYSNAMTAVHRYGEPSGEVFVSQWEERQSDRSYSGSSGGAGDIPVGNDLNQSSQLVSGDGTTNYGTLVGNDVINENNVVVGTYDPDTGEITLTETGEQEAAVAVNVVVDSEGNIVPIEAVVICGTSSVVGFGYRNGLTGDFHNSLTLGVMDISNFCTEDAFRIVNVDGEVTSGAIVGNKYYDSTMSVSVDTDNIQEPRAEVINFLADPQDCAVMLNSTEFVLPQFQDPNQYTDQQLRAWYSGDEPDSDNPVGTNNRLGSLDPTENVPCPEDSRVVEALVDPNSLILSDTPLGD